MRESRPSWSPDGAQIRAFGDDGPTLSAPIVWNPLAADPYLTWALWRAEQVGLGPTPFRANNDIRIVMGRLASLPPRSVGGARLSAILARLLDGVIGHLGPTGGRARLFLALGLPERMGDAHGLLAFQRERARLVAEASIRLEPHAANVEVVPVATGHASFGEALLRAARALETNDHDLAIVGGIDTGYDPEVVQIALDEGRVYDGENLDGFVPGEGGALWIVAPRSSAVALGVRPRLRIEAVARTVEHAHSYTDAPCTAAGLTAAAVGLTKPLRTAGRRVDLWLHDVTSEVYRVHEMNLAWPRAAHGVMPPESTIRSLHPAFGDLGAAFGATAAALAAEAFTRGDPPGARCLITGSSPHEARSAILLGHVS